MSKLSITFAVFALLTASASAQNAIVLRDTIVPARPSICNDPALHAARCSEWRLVSRGVDLNRFVGEAVTLVGRDMTPRGSRCRLLEVGSVERIRFVQESQTFVGTASMAVEFRGTGGMDQRYLLFLAATPLRAGLTVPGIDGPWLLPPNAMIYAGTHVPQGPNAPYLVVRVPNDPSLHGIPIYDQAFVVTRAATNFVIATTNLDCFAF